MTAPPSPSPDLLGAPEGIADPYPGYRAFRDTSPVRYLRLPAGPLTGLEQSVYAWGLLRHADVLAAARDPATFSSQSYLLNKTVPRLALLHDDPPRHTHLRRLVGKAFGPARIAALRGQVRRLADELLDRAGAGPVEFMGAFAAPLPTRIIARLIGIADDDYPAFKRWTAAIVSPGGISAADRARDTAEMMAYFARAIAERRARPADDLLSALLEAEVDGAALSDDEVRRILAVLLVAGNETTTNLLGNLLGLLADRPELVQRAREDRSLVGPLVEEALRFESPVQRFARVTTRPVRVGGVEIGEGELVELFYGAANRDPAVFEAPDEFRPGRADAHLGFGLGTHFCLGAPLARLEAEVSLEALLDRHASITRGEEAAVRQRLAAVSLGYRSLPLVLG